MPIDLHVYEMLKFHGCQHTYKRTHRCYVKNSDKDMVVVCVCFFADSSTTHGTEIRQKALYTTDNRTFEWEL